MRAAVVALGDLGRSARMRYHAQALSAHGVDVDLVGFEDTPLPDNYFDAAIGNIPFGNYAVHDPAYKPVLTRAIHDYFTAKSLDKVRPGGVMEYAMTATAPAQVEFMKKARMPLTTDVRITFTEVVALRRLAYTTLADFIPGVEPYPVETVVEFHSGAKGVRMVLAFDAMHDETWTQRAVMGRESELGKLAKALAV